MKQSANKLEQQKENGPASAGPVFDLLARSVRLLTGAVLVALVILVCSEAFLRGAFNYSLGFAEEVTAYGVVMLTLFGAALALRQGVLFQVNILFDSLPRRAQMVLRCAFYLLALAICVVFIWKTKDLVISSFSRGKFAPTVLQTPLWVPQLLLPSGFVFIALFVVEKLLLSCRNIWAGR